MAFFECPIIGSGTRADSFRPSIADLGIAYSAHIPSKADGTPKFATAIVLVSAKDEAEVKKMPRVVIRTDTEARAIVSVRDPKANIDKVKLYGNSS